MDLNNLIGALACTDHNQFKLPKVPGQGTLE